jgi:hypothetical protein
MRLIFSAVPMVGFLAAAAKTATSTHAAQIAGAQLSNGKGGVMSPWDGYLLAVTFFVMGLGFAYWFCKLVRATKKKESQRDE